MRLSAIFLFLIVIFGAVSASAQNASLLGIWMTEEKDAMIEFTKCDDHYCGRFVWLKDDPEDNPSLDDQNKDPELRKRPLCGLTFLGGFSEKEGGHYDGGWIYSPRHGSMFSAELTLKTTNQLELRGFMFLPLLGGTQVWTRTDSPARCPLMVHKNLS